MINYVENYDPNDSAALHEACGYAAMRQAEHLSARVDCSAPLVLLSHSACGDEAESSRMPYDLPQGKCHSAPKCVPPLKHQKFWEVLCKLKIL